ncbi:MAG: glycosyltransferase, partial [Cyanobacteria bacterium REEB65]|nr:glycosyltransferase [Cyanobacteria bacterium REEB65]
MSDGELHIGLDARMWHHTGIGRYIRALVRELPAFGVRLTVWGPPEILDLPELAHAHRRTFAAPIHSLAEQFGLAADVPRSDVALFHSPHVNMPLLGNFARVVTIHDLIPLHHPETLGPAGRAYFRLMATRLVPARARWILANSAGTREDLVAHGVRPERIAAVSLGVDEAFFH